MCSIRSKCLRFWYQVWEPEIFRGVGVRSLEGGCLNFISHTFLIFGKRPNFFPYKFWSQGRGLDPLEALSGYQVGCIILPSNSCFKRFLPGLPWTNYNLAYKYFKSAYGARWKVNQWISESLNKTFLTYSSEKLKYLHNFYGHEYFLKSSRLVSQQQVRLI